MKISSLKLLVVFFPYSFATLTYAASYNQPASLPLSLREGVPPNIIVTLDDSGSMTSDYVPDRFVGGTAARRSPDVNPLYYNNDFDYEVPYQPIATLTGYDANRKPLYSYQYVKFEKSHFFRVSGNIVYLSSNGYKNSSTTTSSYTYNIIYYRKNKNCSTSDSSANNDRCFNQYTVPADRLENYAIWYAFYRNRNLATIAAANLAFIKMPAHVNLTWQALNSCRIGSSCSYRNSSEFESFDSEHRYNFYRWVNNLPASGGTPLNASTERAGSHFSRDASYEKGGTIYGCTPNFHILMTDGESGDRSSRTSGLALRTQTLPDGETYTPALPYSGDNSSWNGLANTAFYYWMNDINKKAPNDVIPYYEEGKEYWNPKNNPATWQHMSNFIVGLGLSKSLDPNRYANSPIWKGDQVARPTYDFGRTSFNWPSDPIFDLWHAAVNSRGEFFSAESPDDLTKAFERIVQRVVNQTSSATSPAINSAMYGSDPDPLNVTSRAFSAVYSSQSNWWGDVIAQTTKFVGDKDPVITQDWSARDKLEKMDINTRKIFIANVDSNKNNEFVRFDNSSTPNSVLHALNVNPDAKTENTAQTDNRVWERLAFIRGDNKLADGLIFRERKYRLGDIINSQPVTVQKAYYVEDAITWNTNERTKYASFRKTQDNRTPHVYVGANDGMLHAFNANDGSETFAYIPKAVAYKLNQLTSVRYGEKKHEFYVDGKLTVADVYINDKWRTVLIGTLGAGGKGIFALDITEPSADKIKLLWDLDDGDFVKSGVALGYTYGKPTVARFADGKWKAVFGNGYASDGVTDAGLIVLDIATGKIEQVHTVHKQNDTETAENGLSTPKILDLDASGVAQIAYAGDLQGNIWRFDLSQSSSKQTKPVFSATTTNYKGRLVAQAITTAPNIIRHPTEDGLLIVFGTGRYFSDADKSPDLQNSLYGVWDPAPKLTTVNQTTTANELQEQVLSKKRDTDGIMKASLSRYLMDWNTWNSKTNSWQAKSATNSGSKITSNAKGWKIHLNEDDREMVIYDITRLGKDMFFQTLLPNSNACSAGISSRTYRFDPTTGGASKNIFINNNGTLNNDYVAGFEHEGTGGLTPVVKPDGSVWLCTGNECFPVNPDYSSVGRQNWRVVEEL